MVLNAERLQLKVNVLPKITRFLAGLPFAEEVLSAYYCAFDKATPIRAKGTLIAAVLYFVMPFDLIPDILLGLGFTDDIAVLLAAYNVMSRHVTDAHRARARATLERVRRG